MRLWKELPVGERIAITFVIVLAILFALALFGYLTGRWDEADQAYYLSTANAEPSEICVVDDETRERLRGLMFEALDEALKDHVKHVFEIWLRDERGQPARAATGVRAGVKAHQGARNSLVRWNPSLCAK